MADVLNIADFEQKRFIARARSKLRQYGFTDFEIDNRVSIHTDDPRLQMLAIEALRFRGIFERSDGAKM